MSFYKCSNFGAVMNRFSIWKKKLNVKPLFFPATKGFHFWDGKNGKNGFFYNQYFDYILTHRNPPLGSFDS